MKQPMFQRLLYKLTSVFVMKPGPHQKSIERGQREKEEDFVSHYFDGSDDNNFSHGWPVEYDRLALMDISVFHLAHWKNGIAVSIPAGSFGKEKISKGFI